MKFSKRLFAMFLSVVMIMSMLGITALAAGGSTNVEFTVDKSTAQPGDTIIVTFSNKEMKVAAFTGGIMFDKDKLECISIVGPDPEYPTDFGLTKKSGKNTWVDATAVSMLEDAEREGTVGFAYAGATDVEYAASLLYTATFKVKEGASGNAVFTLYEDTACEDAAGTDKFKSDNIETKTVTITGSTPPVTDSYTVKLNANGGSGTMADVTVTKDTDGKYKYTTPAKGGSFTAPEGKKFAYWTVSATNGTVSNNCAGGTDIELTGDTTLTAKWGTPITAANFKLDGYTKDAKIGDITVTPDETTRAMLLYYEIQYICTAEGLDSLVAGEATFEANKDYYLYIALIAAEDRSLDGLTVANIKLDDKAAYKLFPPVGDGCKECYAIFKLDQLTDTPAAHVHAKGTLVSEVPATCTATGTMAYYTCTGCDAKLDESGNEITNLTIEKLPHSYTVETVNEAALKSAANCQSAAVYYKSCSCGAIDKSEAAATFTNGAVDPTNHVGTLNEAAWEKDDTNHWHVYTCCPTVQGANAPHSYSSTGECICGATRSKLNQTITAADVTAIYGDTSRNISATANDNAKLSYTVTAGADVVTVDGLGELTFLKAGTATITISADATENYNSATKTITVTVNRKVIEIGDAGCNTRSYVPGKKDVEFSGASFKDANNHGVSLTKGTDYSAVAEMDDDNAGLGKDVTITITLIGDAANNYTLKSNTFSAKVSISKIDATVPTDLTGKVGERLSNVILPDGWTWVDDTIVLSEVGSYTHPANYEGTINYNSANNVSLTVKITSKLQQTITAAGVTAIYGDTDKKINATLTTGDGELSYTVTAGADVVTVDETTGELTFLKGGEATVTVKAAETDDYAETLKTVNVKVAKAKLTVTAKNQSIYVNGTLPDLSKPEAGKHYTITGLVGDDTVTVTMNYKEADIDVTKTGSYEIEVNVDTDAAKYDVTAASGKLTISERSSGGGHSSSVTSYTITVDKTTNGTITTSAKTAVKGDVITVTVKANKGYELDTLTVLDKNSKEIKLTEKNNKFTFTMPASKVTVKGSFVAEKPAEVKKTFTDVPAGVYYEDAVLWAAEEGITGGTTATTFSSDVTCTRAQAVAFLWRAAGCPAPSGKAMPFTDVAAGSYYYDAVLWAIENGITKGTSETTFSPNEGCTRAQIVAFLWRSQKSPAGDAANPFADVSADAYYADAVLWAVKANVTKGTTDTTFSPDQDCTRAQIVTFIYRCIK